MQIHLKQWVMMYSAVTINDRRVPIAIKSNELLVHERGESRTQIEARQSQRESNRS